MVYILAYCVTSIILNRFDLCRTLAKSKKHNQATNTAQTPQVVMLATRERYIKATLKLAV